MKLTHWLTAMALMIGSAAPATAQNRAMAPFAGYLTPFLGVSSGGEVTEPRFTFGASVSVQEQSGWGAELDLGRAGDVEVGGLVLDATTYMVNASWVRPEGMIRPFGIAGAGIIQLDGCGACTGSSRTYDLGWNAGAGAIGLVNDLIAVRGDVRYFFASADHFDLQRPDNFSFWRISAGVTLMWIMVP